MQVPDCILCRGRLRNRIAAARRQVVAHRHARPVIGAHPCKPCHSAEHSQRGIRLVAGPNICCRIKARHEHDRGRSGSSAFKIQLLPAAATDVDQAGEVTLRRRSLCRRAFAVCRVVHDGTAAPGKQEGSAGDEQDNAWQADLTRSHDSDPYPRARPQTRLAISHLVGRQRSPILLASHFPLRTPEEC